MHYADAHREELEREGQECDWVLTFSDELRAAQGERDCRTLSICLSLSLRARTESVPGH
jgi:hypothetical protein